MIKHFLALWIVIGLSFSGALIDTQKRNGQSVDYIADIVCGVTAGPFIWAVTLNHMVAEQFNTDWRASVARVKAREK